MGKVIKVLAMMLIIACGGWAQSVNWSASNITITTAGQFRELASLVNEGKRNFRGQYITLTSNINLQGDRRNQWVPIGTSTRQFQGTFDGQNNTISGIFINQSDRNSQGLFGVVGENGVIKNLKIDDVNVRGRDAIGGLAGRNYGIIKNCQTGKNISVRSGSATSGQFVGHNSGRISNIVALSDNIRLIGWSANQAQATNITTPQTIQQQIERDSIARARAQQQQQRQAIAENQQRQQAMQQQQGAQQQQATQLQQRSATTPRVRTYKEILTEVGLDEYIPVFEEHRITDLNVIRSLTSEDFREMGVPIGDRRRIIEAFAETQNRPQEIQNQQINQQSSQRMQPLQQPIALHPVFRRTLIAGGLGEYVLTFERYGIDNINKLRSLTREQLVEMGIGALHDKIANLGGAAIRRGAGAVRR